MKVDLNLVETVRKGGNLLVMLVVVFVGVGKKEDGEELGLAAHG